MTSLPINRHLISDGLALKHLPGYESTIAVLSFRNLDDLQI